MSKIITSDFPIFTHEEIQIVNKRLKKYDLPENIEKEDSPAGGVTKTAHCFHIPCTEVMDIMLIFLRDIRYCNATFFGYDLYEYFDLDKFNYNVYQMGQEYGWHNDVDHTRSCTDMKLTAILNLSEEPYEGGELNFFGKGNTKDGDDLTGVSAEQFKPGHTIIFPGHIPHKVTPITRGTRISLSYWAVGPTWR